MSSRIEVAARREAIEKLARQGITTANIVRAVNGTSKAEVIRVRRAAGIASPQATPPLSAEQIERARQLMLDGASRKEAARSVGGTEAQLRKALPELRGWDAEQRVAAEHATGQRAHTAPVVVRRSPSSVSFTGPDPQRRTEPLPSPFEDARRSTTGPFS